MTPATIPAPTPNGTVSIDPPWTLHHFATLGSTNLIARDLPPWHAVRAETQTGGYGRTGRTWVSDAGGLWLSAVLPTPGPRGKWSVLPLAAGWAVIQALESIGVGNLRLRWPNDILSGDRKLAGLLLEQFHNETTVIGLGLNIANAPAEVAPELYGHTVSLNELTPGRYEMADINRLMLHAITEIHEIILNDRFISLVPLINLQWDATRTVELTLHNGCTVRGCLMRIDVQGNLLIETGECTATYRAAEVALLREF